MQLVFQKIQIFCKFESVVDFYLQLHVTEIRKWNHNFAEDARVEHPDEGFHLLIIRVQGVGHNVVYFVRGLVL